MEHLVMSLADRLEMPVAVRAEDARASNMAGKTAVMEDEGEVLFPGAPTRRYRFKMHEDDDAETVAFWLEDCQSKQQWASAPQGVREFVQASTSIPNATFKDYAACFRQCLKSPLPVLDDAGSTTRTLVVDSLNKQDWQLCLFVKVQAFASVWTPKYVFLLKHLSLEPIDVMAAKLRDQEAEILALKTQVAQLTERLDAGSQALAPEFLRATTTHEHGHGECLDWTRVGFKISKITLGSGKIIFRTAGTFLVQVTVQCRKPANAAFVLRKNGKTIASCFVSDAEAAAASHESEFGGGGMFGSAVFGAVHAPAFGVMPDQTPTLELQLVRVVHVKADDELTVLCTGCERVLVGSEVTIAQLQ